MIFFKSKRIRELEFRLGSLKERFDALVRDQKLITDFLCASFEEIHTRKLVRKGGPEKGE